VSIFNHPVSQAILRFLGKVLKYTVIFIFVMSAIYNITDSFANKLAYDETYQKAACIAHGYNYIEYNELDIFICESARMEE